MNFLQGMLCLHTTDFSISFISRYFKVFSVISFLTLEYLEVLFNFQVFMNFPVYSYKWFLVSVHCDQKILLFLSFLIYWNLFHIVAYDLSWRVFIPCALEKSASVGWSVLWMSVRSNSFIVLFRSFTSLLIFFLVVLWKYWS